jgi:hypothetical protein
MPLEILAGTLVSSVLLPLAKKGIEKVGEEIGSRIGKAGAEQTTTILARIRDKVRALFSSESDRDTLKTFEKFPENMKGPLETELATKLAQNPAAARELQALLDDRPPDAQGISIGKILADTVGIVDFRGGTMSGGTVAGVIVGPLPSPPAAPQSNPPRPSGP